MEQEHDPVLQYHQLYQAGMRCLQKVKDNFSEELYIQGSRLLMQAYNVQAEQNLLDFLLQMIYLPNHQTLKETYEKNVQALCLRTVLLSYEDLPICLFPLSACYTVWFEKQSGKFLLQEAGNVWYVFYQQLSMSTGATGSLKKFYQVLVDRDIVRKGFGVLADVVQKQKYAGEFAKDFSLFMDKSPDPAALSFIKAWSAFENGKYDEALAYGKMAYGYRKINADIWRFLIRLYEMTGNDQAAIRYKALCQKHTGHSFGKSVDIHSDEMAEQYAIGRLNVGWAAFFFDFIENEGEYRQHLKTFQGKFLLSQARVESYRYWCGVYNPDNFLNVKANILDIFDRQRAEQIQEYSNFYFDIMRSKLTENYVHIGDETCVLPLAATEPTQAIWFSDSMDRGSLIFGRHEFRFVRLKGNTQISSDAPFAIGEPIVLQHHTKRKKLVLNILLDGLSWGEMKKDHLHQVPNLVNFFSKGIIFNNNYSVAEYTFPSLATIETGMHVHHSQIFHDNVYASLDEKYKTISEQMKELGYYCVNIIGDGRGIYNGVTRGFDRLVVAPFLEQPTYEAVYRTIEHLEAFSECDNFVFMHVSDPHPFNAMMPLAKNTQTKMDWRECVYRDVPNAASVRLKGYSFYREDNRYRIRKMDEQLKGLFDYIEQHYAENEYIVHVYSDHGTSIYTEDEFYFTEEQCGSALMVRGAGIPSVGCVDELSSAMDLYPIMMKDIGFSAVPGQVDGNLPAVFGGEKREYVISNSIFPGQTYKLAIRTDDYEFRLETKAVTRLDGTVNLDDFIWHIYTRDLEHREVFDDALREYFFDIAYKHTESFNRPQ